MSETRKVFKYGPLPIGESVIYMPAEARLLHFGAQHGEQLWVWAEVDPERAPRARYLVVAGTGFPVPKGGTHVGSWVSDEFVWHLFDYEGLAPPRLPTHG